MVRVKVLLWTCLVVLVAANLANGIGVNWGWETSNLILPPNIVTLLLENGIDKVKLFGTFAIKDFAGSGIELMIGIGYEDLELFKGTEYAKGWVKDNVIQHVNDGRVNIKYVAVGSDPYPRRCDNSFLQHALAALQNIQKALNEAGVGHKIKASIPFDAAEVCKSETKGPSGGVFREDIKGLMVQIVHFLSQNNAPFIANIIPYRSVYENPTSSSLDFAFFDGNSSSIKDNKVTYTNAFDVSYDTLVSALSKAGVPDLKVIVGEIGWPTDGDINANVKNAKRFYDGFIKKVASNKGTPLRPDTSLDAYMFSLCDESSRNISRGPFERHWGIFTYNGKPKFSFDFTGKDREPVAVKGLVSMPKQWCVINNETRDKHDLEEKFKLACSQADCTRLGYGASCNNLDFYGNVSFAFNMFFQMQNQKLCKEVLGGMIVFDDPSKGDCKFPVGNLNASERVKVISGAAILGALLLVLSTFF